jgi:hypothetical protein
MMNLMPLISQAKSDKRSVLLSLFSVCINLIFWIVMNILLYAVFALTVISSPIVFQTENGTAKKIHILWLHILYVENIAQIA